MTYMIDGKHFIVLAVGGNDGGENSRLRAAVIGRSDRMIVEPF
jgi:hypothetical protein